MEAQESWSLAGSEDAEDSEVSIAYDLRVLESPFAVAMLRPDIKRKAGATHSVAPSIASMSVSEVSSICSTQHKVA